MPNWCNNNISISGPTETIKTFWDSAQKAQGLLSAICPLPEILEGTTSPTPADIDPVLQKTMIAQTGFDNWYDWQVNAWGTKWDVGLDGLEFIDNGDGTAEINGWFDSAWSPPIEAYQKFDAANDKDCYIIASFHEPGMDFGGFYETEIGEELIENLYDQCKLPETERDDVFRKLDEEFGIVEQFEMWDEEDTVEM